jgi:hypothetical protein
MISRRPAYWTDADEAELAAVVWLLIREDAGHRERCPRCLAGVRPCPAVREAIEAACGWAHYRHLLSRAQWLRQLQEAAA